MSRPDDELPTIADDPVRYWAPMGVGFNWTTILVITIAVAAATLIGVLAWLYIDPVGGPIPAP